MMKTDFLNSALEKMKPKHVFISVLVTIIMISVPPIITISRTNSSDKTITLIAEKQDVMLASLKQTNWSIMTILSGNNNNLTLSSSKEIIRAMLSSSKYRIIKDVDGIIERNNIHDSDRQIMIKNALKIRIDNYYSADYSSMARLYYNNYQLSSIWDCIDKDLLYENICHIIFNSNYHPNDKQLLLDDVIAEINNKFDEYYEIASIQLNKMTINTK